MRLKAFLILMTAIAVVSDSMLHPFYPQYFAAVFGVTSSRHVGVYIACCSLTVLLTFPLWALLARRVQVLHLLVVTQLVTAALCLVCYATTSLVGFWVVSLTTMVFKASYLLIYPYVLSLDEKEQHIGTISLLAFVVYFGNILAALASGAMLQLLEPRLLFVAMAVGDLLQTAVCVLLLRSGVWAEDAPALDEPDDDDAPALPSRFVYRLGAVMFVLYFSAYLTEPFFAAYWERIAALDNRVVSGLVFAIPGVAALLALFANARRRDDDSDHAGIVPALVVALCGLVLQAAGPPVVVLLGRFLYGWALFQTMVRLDLLLFRLSRPDQYAVDFSKVNLFQGLGVLVAAFTAGALVDSFDAEALFAVAGLGFVAGGSLYVGLVRTALPTAATTTTTTATTTFTTATAVTAVTEGSAS